jgi:hypothetical protein
VYIVFSRDANSNHMTPIFILLFSDPASNIPKLIWIHMYKNKSVE